MKVFGIVAAAFLMAGVGAFRPHVPLVARQATTTMFHGAPVAAPAAPARSSAAPRPRLGRASAW